MHSPPYPNAHLFIHPAWHLQCTGPQWAGRRIKAFTSISETGYTGSRKKEGNRNYPNGDLTKDVLNMV